jgi:putative membrane-bound dehydrogenase-like protein
MMQRILLSVVVMALVLPAAMGADLTLRSDGDSITVHRAGENEPILTQNAQANFRPFIHPIVAPDGKGILTEDGHLGDSHQRGLYWGFTSVNGRDYFHKYGESHWRRVSSSILKPNSTPTDLDVRWQTVYDLLDEDGDPVMRETQIWNMREVNGEYILDLNWSGTAFTDITIGEFDYGGLFLRMPWREDIDTHAVNGVREANERAEGRRAVWLDLGMQVEGRDDQAHIAILDHPENPGYPQAWRVDIHFGVGPASARQGDWTIAAGATTTFKHQLLVYTGALDDVKVTDTWATFTNNLSGIPSSQWGLALREAREAEFLTPERAASEMTLQEGFEVNVFAAEPMFTQPMAFCWDDRGRLWIAQNREMEGSGAGVTVTGESQILILEDTDRDGVADTKKVFLEGVVFPSAMAVGFDGLWLGAIPDLLFVPDRDGDDRADVDDIEVRLTGWGSQDLHETLNSFHWGPDGWLYGLQGVFTPSSVGKPAGERVVWQPNAPYPTSTRSDEEMDPDDPLSVMGKTIYADTDGKMVPWVFETDGTTALLDDEGEKSLTGTFSQSGGTVYIETQSFDFKMVYDGELLTWGEGFDTSAFEYADEPQDINGGVWRYHPTKDRFEVVAHGISNPWGIDYDAKGQFFASACVIPHLWHVIPGGRYHRQAGSHFNPYTYSDIRTIGNHRHRSAHGGARVYLSDAFPDEYQGKLFMGNIHEHALLADELEPVGSGFVGHHAEDFLLANYAQFVGFSTEIGPDGAIYMLDWHDADICGDSVHAKDTGRVFRIAPTESQAENWEGRYADLRTLDNGELVKLQVSASAWHARRARVILQNRSLKGDVEQETYDALGEILHDNANADHRLRALWALHVSGGIDEAGLRKALTDSDEYIRAWAIQLLCEDMSPSEAALAQFAVMATKDPSPVVRLYLASALQRINTDSRWPIAMKLVSHGEDADDHNIPHILWYGVEPLVMEDPSRALELAAQSQIPMVTQYIARRLTDGDKLADLVSAIGEKPRSRDLLLLGMRNGLDGRSDAVAPTTWPTVYESLRTEGGEASSIALELSLQFGDAVAAQALVDTLQSDDNSLADRRRAIRGLAERKRPELQPQLIALLDDDDLRQDAIRAMAAYDDNSMAQTVLERYESFSDADKLEVVHALSSRPGHGTQLMEAIRTGEVPKRDVPAYIARLMLRVVGNRFLEVWGPVEGVSPQDEAAFNSYRALLTDEALASGDKRNGRELYNQTCFACHQMYGEGGLVGPDLTGANRTDLTYLLGNILTPSAVIKEDYKMTMVFTDDGQVYSGVIVGEDERQLSLSVANVVEPVVIAKSQITDRELTELSMMPEGLLDYLTEAEVIDLFAYLGTLEPVLMQDAAAR